MTSHILPLAALAFVLAVLQAIKVAYLSRCHFGILSSAALRWQLLLWQWQRKPCAVIAMDIRKMHEGNEILGYDAMNDLVRDLVRIRLRPGRARDLIGQWGGDEIGIAVSEPAAGELVVARLLERMRELTATLPVERRRALAERTGGLVDGLNAAIVLIGHSTAALDDMRRAVDATGPLKAGTATGIRATSGAAGTRVGVLR